MDIFTNALQGNMKNHLRFFILQEEGVMNLKPIVFLVIICFFFSCTGENGGRKATIDMENGIQVVRNPAKPHYGRDACIVTEDLSIGQKEGDPAYMFEKLFTVAVNHNEDIYVLDYQAKHIKMFNSEGSYIKTIGGPGQGPGEFEAPRRMTWSERDGLVVGDLNRVSYFDRDGHFLKSTPMRGMGIFDDVDNKGNIFITDILMEEGFYEIKKFDPGFNFICTLGKSPLQRTVQTGRRNPFFTLIRYDIINGDEIVTGYAEEGYILNLYDAAGNLVRKIEKDYTPLELSQEDVEEWTADDPPERKYEYDIPKHFPPFRTLQADDEGRIWVYTWEKTPDRTQTYFDVFDKEGIFITKIPLKSRPQVIKNNKIYTIEEDEEGFQHVICYSIEWNMKTGTE